MPKADTSVKWFHSDMLDAPALRGEAGALIELLDACLINGFSTRTPDSIVVADEVATVTISAGNPYEQHAVIAITGANVAALNAEWRIATAAASTFTFACPGVADGAATGATVKRAAAGLSKPFSGTNIAVYQSLNPATSQLYLRVDDTTTTYARVRGYEQMTDADTGTGPFPTAAQSGGGLHWYKSYQASATARPWALFADKGIVYLYLAGADTPTRYPVLVCFGDAVPFDANDRYFCLIAGAPSYSSSFPGARVGLTSRADGSGTYVARSYNQTTQSQMFQKPSVQAMKSNDMNHWGSTGAAPVGGGYALRTPILLADGNAYAPSLRGLLPGLVEPLHQAFTGVSLAPFEGAGVLSGRLLAGFKVEDTTYGVGNFAIDLTGPWR